MALLAVVVLTGALLVARRALASYLRRVSAGTPSRVDDLLADLVERTHPVTLLAAAAWIAARTVVPMVSAPAGALTVASVVIAMQFGVWGSHLVVSFASRRHAAALAADHAADATAWTALSVLGKVLVWSVVALVALDNLGIDVTALIAGLGIGGLAVGLALQSVLGDVFASLAIVLDRPFVIGDFLVVGDVAGTVEHIGVKTTRLRALSGEQIVVANSELLKSRIHNFQRLAERRNVLSFGVLYETPAELLERVPGLLRELVEGQPATRLDRAHLVRFGESSIDFEVAYYLADRDFNRHMDVQQAVLLSILRRFADLGIGFAYPTRTLHLHASGGVVASETTLNTKQINGEQP